MLEVVLQNPRSQCRAQFASVCFDRTHNFSAADYFRFRQPGNLGWEHQIDLQLRTWLQ